MEYHAVVKKNGKYIYISIEWPPDTLLGEKSEVKINVYSILPFIYRIYIYLHIWTLAGYFYIMEVLLTFMSDNSIMVILKNTS